MSILSSCFYDHRRDVAFELLYKQNGFEYDEVYSAAISARFPPGTDHVEIKTFSIRSGGECLTDTDDELVCEIPVRGYYCAVQMIQIKARLLDGLVQSTSFISGGFGC